MRFAAGVHSHNAKEWEPSLEAALREYLRDRRVSAVGEIGLDYHYDLSPRESQREVFRAQIRLAKEAEKFHRPIITFVDTSGAYPGKGAEERGQAEAIAQCLYTFSALQPPIICIVLSEGGSGGALARAVADRVWVLENAVYSVVSPEGCASILWKDAKKAKEAAECLHLTAQDMEKLGVVERVISESGKTKAELFNRVKEMLAVQTDELCKKDTETLLKERYERFRKY